MKARLLVLIVGLILSAVGRGEPLSTQPTLGVAAAYSSNPYLEAGGAHSVSDAALLASAPTSYDLDAWHFNLSPSIRYSTGGSYASLASNYFHINGGASFATDLDIVTLTSAFGRDSSLYQGGLQSNGIGVRSDSSTATGDWQRALTARSMLDFNVGWSRDLYNQAGGESGLANYRYLSEGATGTYEHDEITNLQLLVSGGQYVALNGDTRSQNYSLQLGATRQLSEAWTLSASAGYARSDNSLKVYVGPFLIDGVLYGPYFEGTAHSKQQGPVYSIGITRPGEIVNVTLSASRAYRPNGFEYLSRTDTAELDVTYTRSDRWTYGTKVQFQNTATPTVDDSLTSERYINAQLSATYKITPTWLVSLQTNWVKVQYQVPPISANSTGVNLQVSRQFLRIDL